MMMTKLCKDCVWCEPDMRFSVQKFQEEAAKCALFKDTHPVTGECAYVDILNSSCVARRKSEKFCGSTARYFLHKDPAKRIVADAKPKKRTWLQRLRGK